MASIATPRDACAATPTVLTTERTKRTSTTRAGAATSTPALDSSDVATPESGFTGILMVDGRMFDANTETQLAVRNSGAIRTRFGYKYPSQGYGLSFDGDDGRPLRGVTLAFQHPPHRGPGPRPVEVQCEPGNMPACGSVAFGYQMGEGVPKDFAKAHRYATTGCDGGGAMSCFVLSTMYRDGEGVPASQTKASEYHQRACDLGFPVGCTQ